MPSAQKRDVRIGVLVYDGCSAWVVAGILEAFELANVLACRGFANRPAIRFEVRTLSYRKQTIHATSGIQFTATTPTGILDTLVVPPIWHRSKLDLSSALGSLALVFRHLCAFARRSRLVASACSGSVLLAEAGLLERKRVTTCWWLADWFRARYPGVQVAADQLIVADGNTWTAGAGSAYVHLCLKIINSFAGNDLSTMTARFLLVEPNRDTQAPYFASQSATRESASLGLLEKFVLKHIAHPISLSALASAANMSLRTLFRYVERETGITPLRFVQEIRIDNAKNLLEKTDLPMESIAPKCGYEDVSSFRKLFRKRVGMTPREYRQRFGNTTKEAKF